MGRWQRLKDYSDEFLISAVPVIGPGSAGQLMTSSPYRLALAGLSVLGLRSEEPHAGHIPEPLPNSRHETEEIWIYQDDNIELVLRNFGPVSLQEELPERFFDVLAEIFQSMASDPFGFEDVRLSGRDEICVRRF